MQGSGQGLVLGRWPNRRRGRGLIACELCGCVMGQGRREGDGTKGMIRGWKTDRELEGRGCRQYTAAESSGTLRWLALTVYLLSCGGGCSVTPSSLTRGQPNRCESDQP